MRGFLLAVVAAAAACGGSGGTGGSALSTAPPEEFLKFLPDDVTTTIRLPSLDLLERKRGECAALLTMLGVAGDPAAALYGSATPGGMDRARAPGLALSPGGAWVRYLPSTDRATLTRAVGDLVAAGAVQRQEGDWLLLSLGGKGPGNAQGEALPPGDIGLRLHSHPLLASLCSPADRVDLGLTLGTGGCEIRGVFRPGADGVSRDAIERATAGEGGLIDYMHLSLALRMESTLPATVIAPFLSNWVAAHGGIGEAKERAILERLLREGLTALDPATGFGLGIELREGKASAVLVGRIAGGPASAILASLAGGGRHTFGALVLESAVPEKNYFALRGLLPQGKANLEGVPECAFDFVAGLTKDGLEFAVRVQEGWVAAGIGPRGALLAGDTLRRIHEGSRGSEGGKAIQDLVRSEKGAYVLGVVITGAGFAQAPAGDRAALRSLSGAGESAVPPSMAALAGFAREGVVDLAGRIAYAAAR